MHNGTPHTNQRSTSISALTSPKALANCHKDKATKQQQLKHNLFLKSMTAIAYRLMQYSQYPGSGRCKFGLHFLSVVLYRVAPPLLPGKRLEVFHSACRKFGKLGNVFRVYCSGSVLALGWFVCYRKKLFQAILYGTFPQSGVRCAKLFKMSRVQQQPA